MGQQGAGRSGPCSDLALGLGKLDGQRAAASFDDSVLKQGIEQAGLGAGVRACSFDRETAAAADLTDAAARRRHQRGGTWHEAGEEAGWIRGGGA